MACQKKKDLKVAIVGSGKLDEEIRLMASEYGIADNIAFFGFVSNPMKILHDSKMMIFASLWEGIPMSALEAMTLGVPLVSTPTDGLCELITDGITGYISDCDAVLAERIVEIAKDDQLRKTLSRNSREAILKLCNEKAALKIVYSQYMALCR